MAEIVIYLHKPKGKKSLPSNFSILTLPSPPMRNKFIDQLQPDALIPLVAVQSEQRSIFVDYCSFSHVEKGGTQLSLVSLFWSDRQHTREMEEKKFKWKRKAITQNMKVLLMGSVPSYSLRVIEFLLTLGGFQNFRVFNEKKNIYL